MRKATLGALFLLFPLLLAGCGGGTPAPTATLAPGPGQGGGGPPLQPPAGLVSELHSLPVHPGAEPSGSQFPNGYSEGGLDLHAVYFFARATPEEVMRFYVEKMGPLGWEPEITPTTVVETWDHPYKDAGRAVAWVQTWVRKDLRVRLVAGTGGRPKDDESGVSLSLTIEPRSSASFPTPNTPYATGVPSTPPPLPTPVEPIPPIGTGPVTTPTLTPGPLGGVGPTATPILTPTVTPAAAQ